MTMLKKFAFWFICFGLSFLVSDVFGWSEQVKAFLYINLGAGILIILTLTVILVIAGSAIGSTLEMNEISFFVILFAVGELAIILFTTWVATKLFEIDFFVAYQIMTFGQCLSVDRKI